MVTKCKLHVLRDTDKDGLCGCCIDRISYLKRVGAIDRESVVEESIKILQQRRSAVLKMII